MHNDLTGSDVTSFWSIYVTVITLGGIIGCALLLWITASKKVVPSADNTTGHVWDEDLREMNNPMPRWWMGLFVITMLFGVGYLIIFPGLGAYRIQGNWTRLTQYDAENAKADAALKPIYDRFASMSIEQMAGDPTAMAIGRSLFRNNCAQCHGADAKGSKGFPNLTDTYWTWGGSPEVILETITKGRTGVMTPMAAAVGTPEDVRNVANYALSMSNSPHDPVRASQGKAQFEAICSACHGVDGKGNQALGSADLTRGIFIHGPALESHVIDMINEGKMNTMPTWEGKFIPQQLRVLAAYVWGLSNRPGVASN